ncbi:N-acetyltransferase [Candidatus Sumerlaeota bacterium]|nr:N-acetyltransferase [Candidatus Sumerlaeota bacterium]
MTESPLPTLTERKASMNDVPGIFRLIGFWADQRQMLPKSLHQICHAIREFWVSEEGGEVIGCAALRIYTQRLAEICSLAVAPGHQGRGIGQRLVQRCLEEARELGITRVFGLTYQVAFFERLGFQVTPMDILPEKVWRDCASCPFLDNCNETAVIIDL